MPFPVWVGRVGDDASLRRVNAVTDVWADNESAYRAAEVLLDENTVPVFLHCFERQDPISKALVSGVLYFYPQILTSASVQVYVQRLLVDPEDGRLLPPYAPFVRGVVECPNLQVDLSRRHTVEFDPTYVWVRDVVRQEFTLAFKKFSTEARAALNEMWYRVEGVAIPHLLESVLKTDLFRRAAGS
jgi:hypothetical protein